MVEVQEETPEQAVPGKRASRRKKIAGKRAGASEAESPAAEEAQKGAPEAGEDDTEEDEEEAPAEPRGPKRKTKVDRFQREAEQKRATRGVIFLAQLPACLEEAQLRAYFEQFGTVTRWRLARSTKTGNPKGWGWVEFEDQEVAQIAAGTMDKYMIYGKVMHVKYMPPEDVPRFLFKGWRHKPPDVTYKNRKAARDNINDRPAIEVDGLSIPQQTFTQVSRREKSKEKLKTKLGNWDIAYDFPDPEGGAAEDLEYAAEKAAREKLRAAKAEAKESADKQKAEGLKAVESVEKPGVEAKDDAVLASALNIKAEKAARAIAKRAIAKSPAKKATEERPAKATEAAKAAEAAAEPAEESAGRKSKLKKRKAEAEAPAAAEGGPGGPSARPAEESGGLGKKPKRKKAAAAEEEAAPPAADGSDGAAGISAEQKPPSKKSRKGQQ